MTNEVNHQDILTRCEDIPGAPDMIRLHFAERDPLDVPIRDYVDLHLHVNDVVSPGILHKLISFSNRALFYNKALNYLRFRPRTRYEVVQYLRKQECPSSVCDDIVAQLAELRYIDDERYTTQFIEAKGARLSRKELLWKLKQRGISGGVASSVMENAEHLDEFESALQLGLRQWKKQRMNDPIGKRREKVGAFLHRKGFPMSVIYKVLSALPSDEDTQELS